ncbi:MAG: hypothetical protein HYX47_18365 [Burkholderiales bacterium]|nr:hypothetical protein [Burkholderiales bacterium]
MFDFRRIFARTARGSEGDDPASDYHPSDKGGEGLEIEYQKLIAEQFRRWDISTSAVTIEVKRIGKAQGGYDVLVGMVRLHKWERTSALRLLLGLPLLEAKIRKTVRATWLADFSHFGGLWLHASEQLEVPRELRELIGSLAPLPSFRSSTGGPDSTPPSSQIDASASGESMPISS